jgi:hypothetical protein
MRHVGAFLEYGELKAPSPADSSSDGILAMAVPVPANLGARWIPASALCLPSGGSAIPSERIAFSWLPESRKNDLQATILGRDAKLAAEKAPGKVLVVTPDDKFHDGGDPDNCPSGQVFLAKWTRLPQFFIVLMDMNTDPPCSILPAQSARATTSLSRALRRWRSHFARRKSSPLWSIGGREPPFQKKRPIRSEAFTVQPSCRIWNEVIQVDSYREW